MRPAGSPALPAAHPPGAGGEPPLGRRCPGCRYFPPPLRAAAPSRRRRRRGDKSGQRRQNACFAAGVGRAGLGTTPLLGGPASPRARGAPGRAGAARSAPGCRLPGCPTPLPRHRLCSPLRRPLPLPGPPSCSGVFISACLFLGWKIKGLARRPLAVASGAE